MRLSLSVLIMLASVTCLFAEDVNSSAPGNFFPPLPAREFRAAWVATVANIDWPSKPGLSVAQQQAELVSLLDRAAELHFNAILFQVRPVSDALYSSPIEPWSEYLTGRQGQSPVPFYDPLAFAIAEAHRRGLELHAWFNPFRAGHPESKSPHAPNHITNTHPELVWHYGDQTWLNPGEPAAQARALAVVLDVVKRYDVDGVVLDDYFYPYPIKNSAGQDVDFPDAATWEKYGAASGLNREDWRRDNVNRFVLEMSRIIKAAKPWVQFGISPFGIWRPQNPAQIKGFDAYQKIDADSRKWLANGWIDYLSPQLYWPIASREQSFPILLNWWRAQNLRERHVWPALADSAVGGKFSIEEIPHQTLLIRQQYDPGEIHYHLRNVLDNPVLGGIIRAQYAQPALVPASPWIDATLPPRPGLIVDTWKTSAHVDWENSPGKTARWWVFQTRSKGLWKTQIFPAGQNDVYLDNSNLDAIAVRAVDRLGNLSGPTIWTPNKTWPEHVHLPGTGQ
ncbi:MAG: family 10 glycosylhydrolase [Verrucomicrobiota bacterium]